MVPVRRSTRVRRPALSNDYIVLLGEDCGGLVSDPINYEEAVDGPQNNEWLAAMKDELQSMTANDVWELSELPFGQVAFRIMVALVAHFDLELHQMDVKTTFLNGNILENVYMEQPEGFGSEHMVYKLKKSIYGLKQASRQWYLMFDEVVSSFGFIENPFNQCVYIRTSGSSFIFLVLYVDDILLASNDLALLHETKEMLSSSFDMKDLGEAAYVLGIEICRNRSRNVLGLSQRSYIDKVLERFAMLSCKL
ncbi:hypothetical protein MLD38_006467 [Melastoma candidum]|uniref:Uncharacterized protein n=1 Tax=Melastoma candidum TaxID=119954 RepID=A0ACB9RRR2_9MYRT|nr:hypothetical protein MLD38_006467 [Melastoma candidum]